MPLLWLRRANARFRQHFAAKYETPIAVGGVLPAHTGTAVPASSRLRQSPADASAPEWRLYGARSANRPRNRVDAFTASGCFPVNWRERQCQGRAWLYFLRQSRGPVSGHLLEAQPTQSVAAVAGRAYIAPHRGIAGATLTFYAELNWPLGSIPLKEVGWTVEGAR